MEQITLTNEQVDVLANSVADKVMQRFNTGNIQVIENEQYLSPAKAAKIFNVSASFLRELFNHGFIEGRNIGHGKRIIRRLKVNSIQEYLEKISKRNIEAPPVNAQIQQDLTIDEMYPDSSLAFE